MDNQENGVNGTKCKLVFNDSQDGGMSATERDNIIKQGVQIRRNTYRGKDITEYLKNGKLFSMISSGKFDDIYVGDYIVSEHNDAWNKKIVWLIADLDNYWSQGDLGDTITKHHATIIPSYKLQDAKMNPIDSTDKGASQLPEAEDFGAYKGSEMYQITLGKDLKADENTILGKYIYPDFKDHVLKYRSMVSNTIDVNRSNQLGLESGASSNWAWEDRYLDLMSEVNVYGTTIASSSIYDVGIDNRQYAIFQLRPELITQGVSGIPNTNYVRYWYWLKAVATSTNFAGVYGDGFASFYGASNSYGIRPRFLID